MERRTGVQHVHQGHLTVWIHPVYMDHIAVALKLDDLIVVGSMYRTAHRQCQRKEARFYEITIVICPHHCSHINNVIECSQHVFCFQGQNYTLLCEYQNIFADIMQKSSEIVFLPTFY